VVTAAELRELDDVELESRLSEYRRSLLHLRFQLATGQLDNAARLGQVRKDVARVLTVLRDREIALAEGRPVAPEPIASVRPRRTRARRAAVEEAPDTDEAPAEEEASHVVEVSDEDFLPEERDAAEAPIDAEEKEEEALLPEQSVPGAEEPEELREAKRSGLRRRRGRAAKAEAAEQAEASAQDDARASEEEQ
jgi:large subunit ribosomal protein L29